ncbi:MAG: MEDS domain-containing protein, partial [Microlunatus sp.]|nr:MEDS domain-containing protein [Microlunatus sp.]
MNQSALLRAQQSYRHEAFLWRTPADFTDMMVPFVEEGLAADEPVMVALTAEHTQWLHESLSDSAVRQVEFVDMARLGHNPARIIPAWRDFVSTRSDSRQPVRGIGEPIWPGRHAEELLECQLHEALLNLAIDPATPLWLVCPYHAGTLSAEVLHEAQRSHPVIVEAGSH